MSHLAFEECPPLPKRATRLWTVRGGAIKLGTVKWYAPWRRYCFFPNAQCVFEQDCLRELAKFVEDQTRDHKKARREAKGS